MTTAVPKFQKLDAVPKELQEDLGANAAEDGLTRYSGGVAHEWELLRETDAKVFEK